ncbi:hypothetical protein [Thalassolituus oleivorans]|uniref:hypothetical protein n=1 Tax=Thalassolituus oleivorans TaxID=187493 RepID=UPI0023F0CB93|nr:hypothetical protein [Thalassolituus oleivorans]
MTTLVITNSGRSALIDAELNGTGIIQLSEVRLGTGQYVASESQTDLVNVVTVIDTVSGEALSDTVLHLTAKDESAAEYTAYELGIFTSTGVLFAVYSSTEALISKAASVVSYLSIDITLGTISTASLSFGDTDFSMPTATETRAGVSAYTTDEEAQSDDVDNKSLTPKALATRTATEDRAGLIKTATANQVIEGTDTETSVTPAGLSARTATKSRTGLVEKATTTEAEAGTDDKFPDCAGVHAAINKIRAKATTAEAEAGTADKFPDSAGVHAAINKIRVKATTAEAEAGTADKFPDSAGVHAAINKIRVKATTEEAEAGTADKFPDAAGVKSAIEKLAFSGKARTTVWESTASSVDLDTISGGYPGEGFYLITIFVSVSPVTSATALLYLIQNTVSMVQLDEFSFVKVDSSNVVTGSGQISKIEKII